MSVVLITGANKGIGYATARQLVDQGHEVWIGARDDARGRAAADTLRARYVQLDVTDDRSVASALEHIGETAGRLDVLINNAGIGVGPDVVDGLSALRVFDTNVVGALRVIEAALPLLHRSESPAIVNVTSVLGSFGAVTDPASLQSQLPFPVYGASKAALSMLTLLLSKTLPDIRINAVEPGYTDTDFTRGIEGGQPAETAGRVVAALATNGRDDLTGTLQDERGVIPW